MNKAIASTLRNLIIEKNPDLASLAAGLVQTVSRVDIDENNRPVRYLSPMSQDVIGIGCQEEQFKKDRYFDLSPDSRKKSVMYFEDGGVQMIKRQSQFNYYRSKLRLVYWYNMEYYGAGVQNSATIINTIVSSLTNNPVNREHISTLIMSSASVPIIDMSIFNKYSHNDEIHQYMMYPYNYFAIDLTIDFAINVNCMPIIFNDPVPC